MQLNPIPNINNPRIRNTRNNPSSPQQQNNPNIVQGVEELSRVSYGKCNVICLRFLEVIVATTIFGFTLVDRPQASAIRFQLWNAMTVMLFIFVLFAVDIGLAACATTSNSTSRLCISRFNAVELFFNLIMSMFTLAAACAVTAVLSLWSSRYDSIKKLCTNYRDTNTGSVIAATALNYLLCILLIISFYVQYQAYFKAYRMIAQNLTQQQQQQQQQINTNKENQSSPRQQKNRGVGRQQEVSNIYNQLKYQVTLRSDSRGFAFIMLLMRFIQVVFATISWATLLTQDQRTFEVTRATNTADVSGRRLLQVVGITTTPVSSSEQVVLPSGSPTTLVVLATPTVNVSNQSFVPAPEGESLESLDELNISTPLPIPTVILENDTFITGGEGQGQGTPTPAPETETTYEELDVMTIVNQFTALTYVWVVGIGATILTGIFLLWELGRAWQICGCYADTLVGHTFANLIFDTIGFILTWTAGCAGAGITTLPSCVFGSEYPGDIVDDQRTLTEVSVAFMFLLCIAFLPSWFLSFHAYKEWQLMIEGIMPLSVSRDVQRNPQMSPPMPPVISNRTRTFAGF